MKEVTTQASTSPYFENVKVKLREFFELDKKGKQ